MAYNKKIRYLNYYTEGERIRSAGFAKIETQDEDFRLELSLKGLLPTELKSVDVYVYSHALEVLLGHLTIQEGRGEFCYKCRLQDGTIGGEIRHNEISGIRIPLHEKTEILGKWEAEAAPVAEVKEKVAVETKMAEVEKAAEPEENLSREDLQREEESEVKTRRLDVLRWERQQPEVQRIERGQPERLQPERPETIKLREDKWMQLASIYPHIAPFRDEREYLSVSPADFVILSGESYKMANNSFLLHGYFNYEHLILARVERRGEIFYYVGVPGNYYTKEKQVAVMFGFESFECAEEPAQKGDFGYYMMRVNL